MKRTLNAIEINDLYFARRGIYAAAETCDTESPELAKLLREWAAEIESRINFAKAERAKIKNDETTE